MKLFGLIGYPLSHSFSANFFNEKFKKESLSHCAYKPFPLTNINQFVNLIKEHENLFGLNVTIPYKEQVMQYLDQIDDIAKEINAVNTIKIIRNGNKIKLMGFNTDVWGFETAIKQYVPYHKKALILGTGGAAKAVYYILKKNKIFTTFVSRSKVDQNCISYQQVTKEVIESHTLVINATPIGMHPDINVCPDIPYHFLSKKHLLFDMIYNPNETLFLKHGKTQEALTENGMHMLISQAEKSWELWNNHVTL